MTTGRQTRVGRGVAASSVAVVVALGMHLAAGGARPALILLVAVLVLSWLPGVLLIGRRVRLWRQAAVIVPAQFAMHALFAAGGGSTAAPHDSMAGMRMPVLPGWATASGSGTADAPMWFAHGLAAVITVLAWNRGERTFWALCRLAETVLRVTRIDAALSPVPVTAPAPIRVDPPVPLLLADRVRSIPRRGPPTAAPAH